MTCPGAPSIGSPFTSEDLGIFALPSTPHWMPHPNVVDLVGASSLWLSLSRDPIYGWSGVEGWGMGSSWILPHLDRLPNVPALPTSHTYLPGSLRFTMATWMLPSELALSIRDW